MRMGKRGQRLLDKINISDAAVSSTIHLLLPVGGFLRLNEFAEEHGVEWSWG